IAGLARGAPACCACRNTRSTSSLDRTLCISGLVVSLVVRWPLECPNNHANYFSGARKFLVEIQRWQRRFFNDCTQGRKLLCKLFYSSTNLRRDGKAWKGGSIGDPQVLELELWHIVN